MSKSGKTSFYQKAIAEKQILRKGYTVSFDHFKREMMRKVFALKFSGKSDEEIMEYLQDLYNKAMKQKENENG